MNSPAFGPTPDGEFRGASDPPLNPEVVGDTVDESEGPETGIPPTYFSPSGELLFGTPVSADSVYSSPDSPSDDVTSDGFPSAEAPPPRAAAVTSTAMPSPQPSPPTSTSAAMPRPDAPALSQSVTPVGSAVGPAPTLILRASESIWHIEEREDAAPGQRRPLLVIDEKVTHLADTDQVLEPERLRDRARAILQAQQVPVELGLFPVAWTRDPKESRPRLVAWLGESGSQKPHPYSDVKLLFGVDYLGHWASITLQLAIEAEPLPAPAPPPSYQPPIDAIIAIVLGVLTITILVGIIGIAYGAWRLWDTWQKHQQNIAAQASRYREEVAQQAQKKAQERLARTFKVDDMRLFCSAMGAVYRTIVDDIVGKGGEVVRVQGGQGGYFDNGGLAQPAPLQRRDDAALSDV